MRHTPLAKKAFRRSLLPGSTKIRVRDAGGGQVGSQSVTPLEGDVTTSLVTGVLDDVAGNGLQYRIEVGNGLIDRHDFRVAIDCPAAVTGCVYTLEEGVLSESAVPVDPELALLLDGLGAIPDALAVALAVDPTLAGKIATLALELSLLDQRVAIPTGGCSCIWTYSLERTPGARVFDPFEGQPFEEGGFEGAGAAHYAAAQSIGLGATGLTVEGTNRLAMDLRCWEFQSPWGIMTVNLPGGPEDVDTPILTACPAPCSGEIQHELRFEARLAAVAVGGPTSTGISAASQLADYSIDGDPLLNELWAASAVGDQGPAASAALLSLLPGELAGNYETDVECADRSLGQVRTAPTTAELHTFSNVLANGGADGFGVAETGNRYRMQATGLAACAVEPAWQVAITDSLSFAGDPVAERAQKLVAQPFCWD